MHFMSTLYPFLTFCTQHMTYFENSWFILAFWWCYMHFMSTLIIQPFFDFLHTTHDIF